MFNLQLTGIPIEQLPAVLDFLADLDRRTGPAPVLREPEEDEDCEVVDIDDRDDLIRDPYESDPAQG